MKTNKKIIKIVFIILILLTLGLVISNSSFAWDVNGMLDDVEANAEQGGRSGNTVTGFMGALINMSSTVAAGVAIIMLIVIGVKYTSVDPSARADAKKDLTGYVVGAVILFGVSGILKLLQMFINGNLNNV